MKFCMFCGQEIQTEAVFCPFCGKSQNMPENTDPKVKTVNIEKIKPSQSEKKIERVNLSSIKTKEKQQNEKEDNDFLIKDIGELEVEDGFFGYDEDDDLLKELEQTISESQKQKDTSDDIMKDMLDSNNENSDDYNDGDDYDGLNIDDYESNKTTGKRKFDYDGKSIDTTEEDALDESDGVSRQIEQNSLIGKNSLTADEKAEQELEKKEKEEKKKNIKKGEGRKSTGRKKEARKNVDREIAKRKVNEIEHEEISAAEQELDKDYDGYYENVKPIDFDKQRTSGAMIQVILTGAAVLAIAGIAFYYLFTFFMS